jgi:hypothetical protein
MGHLFKMGLMNHPTCERRVEDESATHVLCDCKAIFNLKFRRLGQYFLEPSDYYYASINKVPHVIRRINKTLLKIGNTIDARAGLLWPTLTHSFFSKQGNILLKTNA